VEMLPDLTTAHSVINHHNPDVVFLDIELPGQNGFQLLDYFKEPDFEIIFTTAYSEYAVKAFEVSAIDYLLKPIQISKLQLAVEKLFRLRNQNTIVERVNTLRENLQVKQIKKVALPTSEGLLFFNVDDIMYLEAEGSYTYVVSKEKKIIISKKIKEFAEILSEDNRFFRVHRSYIINVQYIKKYQKHDGTCLWMEDAKIIPIARERKHAFDDLISSIRL
jgi:two-component system LytT family response regulator